MNPNNARNSGIYPSQGAIMSITCNGHEQFMAVIQDLVQRGLGFRANYDSMSITLTGAN